MQPVEVTDKKGRVWLADPARHLFRDGLPRVNPHTGVPMPRGGRKPNVAGVATSGTSPTPPAAAASPEPAPIPVASDGAGSPPPAPTAAPPPSPPPSFEDLRPLLESPAHAAAEAAPPPPTSSVEEHEAAAGMVADGAELVADVVFDDNINIPANEKQKIAKAYSNLAKSRGWNYGAAVGLVLLALGFFIRIFKHPKPKAQLRAWLGFDSTPKNVTPPARPSSPAPPSPAPVVNPAATLPPTNKLG